MYFPPFHEVYVETVQFFLKRFDQFLELYNNVPLYVVVLILLVLGLVPFIDYFC